MVSRWQTNVNTALRGLVIVSGAINGTPRPGLTFGYYPERRAEPLNPIDDFLTRFTSRLSTRWQLRSKRMDQVLASVNQLGVRLTALSENEIEKMLSDVRSQLIYAENDDNAAIQAFAIVREMSYRVLGMRHYESQILGGWSMYQGNLAEMQTGEGKTLAAVLPAVTAALAGIPVHVITVNDYLANRDASLLRPLYESLGLSVGVINESLDSGTRQAAYACDVTYCTNKQVCFDYLRDLVTRGKEAGSLNLNLERLYTEPSRQNNILLRGLCFAIVDEADSVLIDEARTPLILSQESHDPQPRDFVYDEALRLADQLKLGSDYDVNFSNREINLAKHTMALVAKLSVPMSGVWEAPRQSEELIRKALTAQHFCLRNRDYILKENKIKIVNQNTGRVMRDHSWDFVLQRMVEAKEKCKLSGNKRTLARISYQRFFRRYLRLSGMTGTACEVKRELRKVYGLGVVRIPPHRKCLRVAMPATVFQSVQDSHAAITLSALQQSLSGRPVLIGTRSVEVSEQLAEILRSQAIDVQVLNARQDENEAKVIAAAGLAGRITVATNMAGRGTDIHLGPGVHANGGLHVILTELNDSSRVDRQLIGRCARQGEPGSYQCFSSLDDELIKNTHGARTIQIIARLMRPGSNRLPNWFTGSIFKYYQRRIEHRYEHVRRMIEKEDERLERVMSFTGMSE